MKIFTINPGSTSTKIALFDDEVCLFTKNVKHESADLERFASLPDQIPYREQIILNLLEQENISLKDCKIFVGRGGGLFSMEGGVYEVNDLMLDHARNNANGVAHPANLGSLLADQFSRIGGGRAFVVNPPDVDEYQEISRVTGIKGINRASHIHALNHKETALRHAKSIQKKYEECNFIVGHIGGGISIAAHKKGRMIDGNDIVAGEGPMAPTRAGSVPADQLIRLCFSGNFTEKELLEKCTKSGGFVDHLGTSDALEVFDRAENGDQHARLLWDALIYQIVKQIGAMAAALHGEVDAILLSGGMVYNKSLVENISEACTFIAPVQAYPGEFEMQAMAAGAMRVMKGTETAKVYTGVPVWTESRL
ncbi:butyrate kinase [Anoxybacterium hadale]|uniref:Butyrate kinase n=1 Tax=Anoxybacterium hadale TaxID=3408580 RepID=A0ACD1A6B1_9FIRM|nr:butyrate kinase [Clostridiales bacterium]